MTLKIIKWLGLTACVLLIIACFLPWTYHADIDKIFTGLFSEKNAYGKPGKYLIFVAVTSAILILLQKVWAKRIHLFFAGLTVGYAIKTYVMFTSCYNAYCPDKKISIYLMMVCCIVIFIASVFPDLKLKRPTQTPPKEGLPNTQCR
jgi:predicted neutral ceramidase superfamily lipid hydrolase